MVAVVVSDVERQWKEDQTLEPSSLPYLEMVSMASHQWIGSPPITEKCKTDSNL
jgi:hypothetical protein